MQFRGTRLVIPLASSNQGELVEVVLLNNPRERELQVSDEWRACSNTCNTVLAIPLLDRYNTCRATGRT